MVILTLAVIVISVLTMGTMALSSAVLKCVSAFSEDSNVIPVLCQNVWGYSGVRFMSFVPIMAVAP
jgi:hypothetical protein